jgi:hypothetical protein
MVEEDLLYLACREGQSSDRFAQELVEGLPNVLAELPSSGSIPDEGGSGAGSPPLGGWASVIHVVDLDAKPWTLVASSTDQRAIIGTAGE